jgi:D-apionate oxidoisomerase
MQIALMGAGGKMGSRLTDNLKDSEYEMRYVEISEAGRKNLESKGLTVTAQDQAIPDADIVILAVPDVVIGKIGADVVPHLKSNAMLIVLDPAAAHMGHLPNRKDISYFVTHPCHPPIFNDETTEEAKNDFFGGKYAKQSIVCALMQGPEEHYLIGEEIARSMYGPILRSHRVTVEQMAVLEPAMAETVLGTCVMTLREAMEEAVRRGVPYEAARDFMLGHLKIELAIAFDIVDSPFSDAAMVAIEYGKKHLLKPEWRDIFNSSNINESIDWMLHPEKLS